MNNKKIIVTIDTTPLSSGHAVRGIGIYTKYLVEELSKINSLIVQTASTEATQLRKPDIIHYPYFDLFFNTLPLFALRKRVVTVHDVIPLLFKKQYEAGIKGGISLLKQTISLRNTQAIITDSEASKRDIHEQLGISLNNIHVVYLAGNPEITPVSEAAIARLKHTYDLPEKYILYVGDINYNKNIPQLIKSLKFIDESISLVCFGRNFHPQDIPEWQAIDTQIEMSNVRDRVVFLSNIENEVLTVLSGLYSGALAYVQPSLYEGFGLPVLEAMACRTPVISSANSSLVEVGGEYALYAAEPAAESFAQQITAVAEWSKTKRSEWVKAAATWASQFNWKKTAQQTAAVYRSTLV